jgi:hypothetical protein
MIAEVRGSDWRVKEYTAKNDTDYYRDLLRSVLTNRAVRNAKPRGRLARLVGTGGAMAMATTLLPPGLCLSGASCVRAYANYVTFNAISTDYVLRRSHICILDLFRFCSCYDLEHVFCVFWWLLSISGCLLFRPDSTLFLSLHYSTPASGTLKVIVSRFIISSLFRSDFHFFFGMAFSQWWF